MNLQNYFWLSQRILTLILRLPSNRKQKAAMLKSNLPRLKKIAEAIIETQSRAFVNKETEAIEKIERLRKEYLNSETELPVWTPEGDKDGKEKLSTVTRRCSRSQFWDSILFKLVRHLKPQNVLEIGSCVGFSAAYLAESLQINGFGSVVTLEGSPHRAETAKSTLSKLSFENAKVEVGLFDETLPEVLTEINSVDFAFIDGNHKYAPTIKYFETLLPYLSQGSVVVFDDINYSPQMLKAWKEIKNHNSVSATVDLFVFGIALVKANSSPKQNYRLGILKP